MTGLGRKSKTLDMAEAEIDLKTIEKTVSFIFVAIYVSLKLDYDAVSSRIECHRLLSGWGST
jgi:hypothetical protein